MFDSMIEFMYETVLIQTGGGLLFILGYHVISLYF
jgi:hypothetical protein